MSTTNRDVAAPAHAADDVGCTPALTAADVARLLNLRDVDVVCRLAREGRLRGVRVGRRLWRFTRDAVDSFLRGDRADAPAGPGPARRPAKPEPVRSARRTLRRA
jgi:excisionase family DNA binding protein